MSAGDKPSRGTPTLRIGVADVERRRARDRDEDKPSPLIAQLAELMARKQGL